MKICLITDNEWVKDSLLKYLDFDYNFTHLIGSDDIKLSYDYIFVDMQVNNNGGPSIIKQRRVGLHGKHLNMYKFRTMKKGSHGQRDELKGLNTQDGPLFKIENDPRILKGASVLRQYSLSLIHI